MSFASRYKFGSAFRSSFKGSLVGFRMRFLRGGNLRECCGVRVRGSFRFSGKEVQLLSELWSLFGLMVLLGDIILYIPGRVSLLWNLVVLCLRRGVCFLIVLILVRPRC